MPKPRFSSVPPADLVDLAFRLSVQMDSDEAVQRSHLAGEPSAHPAAMARLHDVLAGLADLRNAARRGPGEDPPTVKPERIEPLKAWLEQSLSDAGWRRLLAARRQRVRRAHLRGNGVAAPTAVALRIDPRVDQRLAALAHASGLDKPAFVDRLSAWLSATTEGAAALEALRGWAGTGRAEDPPKAQLLP
jgi:hypothetical protein